MSNLDQYAAAVEARGQLRQTIADALLASGHDGWTMLHALEQADAGCRRLWNAMSHDERMARLDREAAWATGLRA